MNQLRAPLAFALSLAAAAVTFSFTPAALAADTCKSDSDCGAGFFCELSVPPSVGCASKDGGPADCPAPTPAPAAEGFCREKPLDCKADADCPAYMACQSTGDVAVNCTAPACPPGSECPEPAPCEQPAPDPNAPKICVPKMIECTSDAACPTGFGCNIELGVACPAIDCAPNQPDCKQPECPTESKKLCGPKEIDCKADADCPSDWRCITFEEGSCSGSSGGGSTGTGSAGGTGTEPAPAPTPVPPSPGSKTLDTPPDGTCTTTTRNLCAPKGYIAGIEQGNAPLSDATGSPVAEAADGPTKGGSNSGGGAKNSSPSYSSPTAPSKNNATPGSTASSSSDDGGCSSSGRGDKAGLLGALLVGLVARLSRKRSR